MQDAPSPPASYLDVRKIRGQFLNHFLVDIFTMVKFLLRYHDRYVEDVLFSVVDFFLLVVNGGMFQGWWVQYQRKWTFRQKQVGTILQKKIF